MPQTLYGQSGKNFKTDFSLTFGFLAILLFFIAAGTVSYGNIQTLQTNNAQVTRTHDTILALNEVLSLMKDAETGQRGYLLSGRESYLEPYNASSQNIVEHLEDIEGYIQDNPTQQSTLVLLKKDIQGKFDELAQTIDLRREKGFAAALAVVNTGRGKTFMDSIRTHVEAMQAVERTLRTQRIGEMDAAYRVAIISGLLASILGIFLAAAVTYLLRRAANIRRQEEWLKNGQIGLGNVAAGDQRVEQLAQNILKFLSEYLGAQAAAFFVKNGGEFQRAATYGVPAQSTMPVRFGPGDGLLGQAAKDRKSFYVDDLPENYLHIGSALGQVSPRYLAISPTISDDEVNAVFELGFLETPGSLITALLDEAADTIGVAIRAAKFRSELQDLLEETQRQAEELQAQGEELRVSNEELEEQSRALKESQVRLEQQQAELEQTNAQLEEQTQQLEIQRDDLSRAQGDLQKKSDDLERTSQYKSDFLANMSHELRTPLNSSLILAKLLADNSQGNLTDEQVKFASTIQTSGNDLLALINDILDLSKIEAGHMEVNAEVLPVERLNRDLKNLFEPIAKDKGLGFKTTIAPGMVKSIETDRQRLEQILKNLLSNALKFTETGSVELSISQKDSDYIVFAVSDTGIGISDEHQQAIFDAFRQADGTISRKYGGTGLGLSISRELARLLGGRIELHSAQGTGSTFSLILPAVYKEGVTQYNAESVAIESFAASDTAKPKESGLSRATIHTFADDRDVLQKNNHVILVIEDDESFAKILYDLAHEMNFQCLVAGNAEEALSVCKQYRPSAVVLDVGLPDNSGLSVLDRLKRDPKTRHIPVHVVSAGDYTETAFSLGAAGYMLKPVKREELEDAFKGVEALLKSNMRRILLVEDDKVQRESVMKLFDTHNIETVAVGSAAECLEKLESGTFDCMILDLSLPDLTGYTLLETLSESEDHSFPPVIVYTGRDLTGGDEQKLRRYSKSIIIKGAKSPERLLDEVTLFLHQVVSDLPVAQQKMLEKARHRDAFLEGRRILVVEDDIRNVYAVTNIFEPLGAIVQIARNGREALEALKKSQSASDNKVDLILMDVMMPEMDGLTATREIRKNRDWRKLPIIMLTAKAMRDDQERCLEAGANDYMAKPIDVEKLISLVRVWMPR